MQTVQISAKPKPLKGRVSFPGDKSLSHRAILFGALAEGRSRFSNILPGEDCVCTRSAFEAMGVKFSVSGGGTDLQIEGRGLHSLKAPASTLYLGNSGTSMRLLMGVLAGQPFTATLSGDPSLSSRPMRRVADPLRRMGASIDGRDGGNFAPITVRGGKLKGADISLPVASAQVKSAILLAGLYADGVTRVTEPEKSRDHTERFLRFFGAQLAEKGNSVSIKGGQSLAAREFAVAGDISSAAFFMAMALLLPGSELQFQSVLDNPTRTGIQEVLKRMGVRFVAKKAIRSDGPEPAADFSLTAQPFEAFEIRKENLPALIDEIPILTVLATQAKGKTAIHDAAELRVKETDRIHSMVSQLSKMGARIRSEGDTILIEGPTPLRGAVLQSFKDHRTAMSLIVAGMIASGETVVEDTECINTSFPTFFELLESIGVAAIRRG